MQNTNYININDQPSVTQNITLTQYKHKKTRSRISRLLRHLAWKLSRSILKGEVNKKQKYNQEKNEASRKKQNEN